MNELPSNLDVTNMMADVGKKARVAARFLSRLPDDQKVACLRSAADHLTAQIDTILEANQLDLDKGRTSGRSAAQIDRLELNESRIHGIANGLHEIARLPDPVGQVIAHWQRPNGLDIQRVRTPLGVIGVIYESRPNVTADAGALCLKSGNAAILRGGSDAYHSSKQIHACMEHGLRQADIPLTAIQFVPTTDRAAVGEMLAGLSGNLDVIVPRGGRSLVHRVQQESRVPVFAHLEGICHVYVDRAANLQMACEVTQNAKIRRTGICGAAETLLIDHACLDTHLTPILNRLHENGCEIRGDEEVCRMFLNAIPATENDWSTEYLEPIISVKVVSGVQEAIDHIMRYSSGHTDSVITEDREIAERFLNEVDSAIVMHNTSTQFADGGEFGMGAEIGIATGKMHARGPVGVEQLTSFNYRVRGSGQLRPK